MNTADALNDNTYSDTDSYLSQSSEFHQLPQQPGDSKKSDKRRLFVLLSIAIIITLLISGGKYFLGQNQKNSLIITPSIQPTIRESKVSENNFISVTPIFQEKISTIQKEGMKKYEGKRISFEYPSDWKISTQSGFFLKSPGKDLYEIEFYYLDYTDFESDKEKRKDAKQLIVDNKKAIRYSYRLEGSLNIAETYYDTVVIEQIIGEYMISAVADNLPVLDQNKLVLNQILESVKFKTFFTNGCGGIDTQGELLCQCTGRLIKPIPPPGGLGIPIPAIGSSKCEGACGSCCYKGMVKQNDFPACSN
jgi:hypothetical protein